MYRHKDDAASDVIAFILILALIISAVAGWMLVIIPGQGYEAESAHNEKVLQEFTELKTVFDQLWLNGKKGYSNTHLISLAPTERTSLSTLFYLAPTLGSGRITVEKGTKLILTDTYVGAHTTKSGFLVLNTPAPRKDGLGSVLPIEIDLLRISFFTDNKYAPNYTIIYEGGAVFYTDATGNTYNLIDPVIDADYDNPSIGKNYVLIAADNSLTRSVLLGNLPVTITYKYKKSFNEYTTDGEELSNDYRRINGAVTQLHRDYVEVYYTGTDTPKSVKVEAAVTDDTETELNQNIADYWEDVIFKKDYRKEINEIYVPVTDDGADDKDYSNPDGDIIQVKYYDISVASEESRSGGV